jgi:hypothetical protein
MSGGQLKEEGQRCEQLFGNECQDISHNSKKTKTVAPHESGQLNLIDYDRSELSRSTIAKEGKWS